MKPPFKKLIAVLGSAAIGALGALTIATPAQAHHTDVTATTECAADGWIVNWTVTNWNTDKSATIDRLEPSVDVPITGELSEGATLAGTPFSTLTGQQLIPLDTTSATLKVTATWSNDRTATNSSEMITINAEECAEPSGEPAVEAVHTCVGLSVTVTNPENGNGGEVILTPSAGEAVTVAISPGFSQTFEFPAPPEEETFSVAVSGAVTDTIAWAPPSDCQPVTLSVVDDCEGMTFTVTNPDDAEAVEVVFTPTTGESRTVTSEAGTSMEVAFAAAGDDFAVTVASGEYEESFGWLDPADCDALPTTGTSTTMWLASGATALVLGAGLIFLMRRRKAAATW